MGHGKSVRGEPYCGLVWATARAQRGEVRVLKAALGAARREVEEERALRQEEEQARLRHGGGGGSSSL